MSETVARGSFTAQDCAYALQYRSFTNFRRDLTRHGLLIFPRKTAAAPGGGEYRYPHIVEMALHLALSAFRLGAGKAVMWGLARELQIRGHRIINAMDDDTRHAIYFGGSGFEDDDYPEAAPRDLGALVDFPSVYFGPEIISRDEKKSTFLLFEPVSHKDHPAKILLSENVDLAAAQQKLIAQAAATSGSAEHLASMEEVFDFVPAINLTTMLMRLDERLALRLKARSIRGD